MASRLAIDRHPILGDLSCFHEFELARFDVGVPFVKFGRDGLALCA
jgi:hypothetical protein